MRKGQKMSEESKNKVRASLKGRRCSMSSEFGKGHVPWNKGTKGLMKANKGSFKKGNKNTNSMNGYKVCKDGIYVRVGSGKYSYQKDGKQIIVGKYESLARKKYREAFGEFDKKLIIFHKDGDIYNNDIDNLELITRAELLKRNYDKNPQNKDCVICGKQFPARTNYHKTCSEKCRDEHNKDLNVEYQKKWRAKQRILKNTNTYITLPQPL